MSERIQINRETLHRLVQQAKAQDMQPDQLAAIYIEEGLRMEEHPLVKFNSGPSGRRAHIVSAGDVWEIVLTLRDNQGNVRKASDYLEVDPARIFAAAVYYASFPSEIDMQIDANIQAEELAQKATEKALRKLADRPRPWHEPKD